MLSDGESLVPSLPATSSFVVSPIIVGDFGEVGFYKLVHVQGSPSVAVAFVEDL